MDDNRELRAMLFSVIHIPPLPSIVSRLDREDYSIVDDSAVESSHSIIGSMLEWTAIANNNAANTMRMNMQCGLVTQFKSDLMRLDPTTCPVEDLYNFYCHHTRLWLNSYSKVGSMMRFKPLDYVLNNDKTHQNMQGYTKAQYHLFTDGKECLDLADSVSYADLLRKCAQWTKESYEAEAIAAKTAKTESNTELKTELNTELKTELNTELKTESNTESNAELNAELNTELKTESNTTSANENSHTDKTLQAVSEKKCDGNIDTKDFNSAPKGVELIE